MGGRVSHAIFGAADGMTSLIGVLAGLAVAHTTPTAMLTTVGGLAVAGGVSMASGDYLAGAGKVESVVMGLATLAGSALPAIPILLLPDRAGYFLGALLVLALAVAISEARYEGARTEPVSRVRAYTTTGLILAVAAALAIWTTVILGAVG